MLKNLEYCLINEIFSILINRQGCSTSEDMLWKLDALQSFIKDLHWPDEVFAEHLEHRLKQMASDMIEACGTRYLFDLLIHLNSFLFILRISIFSRVMKNFDSWMKKGALILTIGTDYVLPQECCVMINVIIDCKAQVIICKQFSHCPSKRIISNSF